MRACPMLSYPILSHPVLSCPVAYRIAPQRAIPYGMPRGASITHARAREEGDHRVVVVEVATAAGGGGAG